MAASKGMEFARDREREKAEGEKKERKQKKEREGIYRRDIILYVVKRCGELSSVERLLFPSLRLVYLAAK